MAFAQYRFRAFAPVLALAISLAFAGGCKGSDNSAQVETPENSRCPSLAGLPSNSDPVAACTLLAFSQAGKFPKKFTYTQAEQMIQYGKQLHDSTKADATDPLCIPISGLTCGETFFSPVASPQ